MTRKITVPKRRNKLFAGIAIAAITSGALGVITFAPVMAKTVPAHTNILPVERAGFADLIEAVSPAVVAISTSGNARSQQLNRPDFRLPPRFSFRGLL